MYKKRKATSKALARVYPKQKKATVNTKYKPGSKKPRRIIPASTMIPASMPMSQKFLFKFEDIVSTGIVLNGETVKIITFNINNLNALDAVGNGLFPTGFSNWSRFYRNFLVHYARINVEFVNNTSNQSIYGVIAFRPIFQEATWNTWQAWRNLDSNSFPNKQVLMTPKGGSKDNCKISVGCNLAKLIGKPDAWNSLESYSGSTGGAAPTTLQEAYVTILSGDSNAISANVTVKISIDVIASLYYLKAQFNGSSA